MRLPRRPTPRGSPLLAPLLALAALAACAPRPPPQAADPAVARVGGETLHLSDVARAARARDPASAGAPLDPASALYRDSLQAAVDQRLLAIEAERLKLEHDPGVKRRLAAARDKVLGDAALEHEVESQVGDADLRALYDAQRRQARPQQEVEVAQIVLASRPEADEVKAQLVAGADFGQLAARRSSDAATRFAGGELGWLSPSALPGAYGAALGAAAPGEWVGPLQRPEGWVVARVEGRRPAPQPSFAEARPQLVRFLAYARLQSLMSRLRARTEVILIPLRRRRQPAPSTHAPPAPAPGGRP